MLGIEAAGRSPNFHRVLAAALAACALLLCWNGVSWALRPGTFLFADEIGNLPWLVNTPYRAILHLFPQQIYNDRPTGEALERFLYESFGFDYRRQVACFLCFHFVNCALVFLLFRCLGVSAALSIAFAALFASLNTSAMTATYIGASFDVLCTLFILASLCSVLARKRRWWYLSAVMFLFALRSKEFAIVLPVLLTFFVVSQQIRAPWRRIASAVCSRLWPHYLILVAFGLRYLSFVPNMVATIPRSHPYYLSASPQTIFQSFLYYSAIIFTLENRGIVSAVPLASLALLLGYATWRRNAAIVSAILAYFFTLLPTAMLPNMRQYLYVYCPQVFVLLALALFVEGELARLIPVPGSKRWYASFGVAVAVLAVALAIRTSGYFRMRIGWYRSVRATCLKTAGESAGRFSKIGPGAHLYIDSGDNMPWLFTAGPCDYLKLLRRDRTLSCVIQKPAAELRLLYERDTVEKYLVEYAPDGSLSIRDSAASLK